MSIQTVCVVYQSPNVGKSIIDDLAATLGGHVRIVGQRLADLDNGPADADYFIVPSHRAAEIVKRARPEIRTMVSKFTLNVHELPRLLRLRSGTICLVVAGSQETAEDAVRILQDFGFGWLRLEPYWSGKIAVPEAKTAITLGSSTLCPPGIANIIDLGPRRPDIVTLIRLCLDLDLPRKVIDDILTVHFDQITGLGRDYLALYQESDQDRAYLKALIDSTKDAIAAFDNNGIVMHSNTLFQRLSESADFDLGKFLDNHAATPSVEQVNGNYFVVEKLSVNVQDETQGTLLVMRSTEKVSKAEGALRRAFTSKRHAASYGFEDILGVSPAITKFIRTAKKIAPSNLTVLITGETGTGKELVAHAIHSGSPRADEPFVCTHFAAMPATLIESELFGYDEGAFTGAKKGGHPGYFELAHKGTIFLDEIGDLPANFQPHLLRVIEDRRVMRVGGNYPVPIDVRLIAATNRDLESMVKQGRFREDLFYRLQVIPLSLPPLRSRPEDIPMLAAHFLSQADRSGRKRFSPGALEFMQGYPWPGNIRQMASVIHFMVHTSENEVLDPSDLPPGMTAEKPGGPAAGGPHKSFNRNNRLVFTILSTLAESRDGKGVGKKALLARSREKELVISDCLMRRLLHEMDGEGLIRIGSTSQGTAITEKGMSVLDSMSPESAALPQSRHRDQPDRIVRS